MRQKIKFPFSNLTINNWQNLLICTVLVFYSVWLSFAIGKGPIKMGFSGDYLAFWSAGKIADEKGYSEIYDLENLKSVQLREVIDLGILEETDAGSYSPFPVAILSIFVIPFQILSKFNFELSYWVWTFINIIALVGYLIYYTKEIFPGNLEKMPGKKLLLLMLLSYPVWFNLVEGQINVFLVICVGEYIRQAINNKPVLSGLWLGGLLLKPQLLILIIPTLLIMVNWKAISGFIISSSVLFVTSLLLSRFMGMQAMVDLWTRFSAGIATNSPAMMINWRMIGVNINSLFVTSFAWVITGLGMLLTIVLVCFVINKKPSYGSSKWVITMAVVFSATLAVTWHSHQHMAVVLIPFLIYASLFKYLPYKTIFLWTTVTPVLHLGLLVLLVFLFEKYSFSDFGYLVAISGFILNFLVISSLFRYLHSKQNTSELLFVDNPKG